MIFNTKLTFINENNEMSSVLLFNSPAVYSYCGKNHLLRRIDISKGKI